MAHSGSYIDAAFRSSRKNEAYLFMKDTYVLLTYTPGTTNCKVIFGPTPIADGFPSLAATVFGVNGIDCAFGSHDKDEAFIFSGKVCAHINYAPHSRNDYIIKGPMTIAAMFPFLKGTVFESGIDAAFESTKKYTAYIFKGNQYASIYYNGSSFNLNVHTIHQNWHSLRNTIFESGMDAAFAMDVTDEAYLFKGDSYTRINFAPGTTNDHNGGVKKILPYWPALQGILPRKN